ncbi:MAG: HAD family hydrolase [Eubacterium sp.]|nr:HAD family hydrolase [Eubacterium sp.]
MKIEEIKNRICLVAFDLDDTALDGQGKLTEKTAYAIKKASQCGIEPVIASGRSFNSLPEDIINVPGIRYAICSNGANIFDVLEKKCISSYTLNSNSVRQIVELADDYSDTVFLDAFTKGVPHTDHRVLDSLLQNDKISEHRKIYLKKTRIAENDIRSFIRQNETGLDCINYNVFDSRLFDQLMYRLSKEVEGVYVTSSIPELIEISDEKSGKAGGLKRIAELLKIDISETAAFGNADNDAEMIRCSGLGYAVSNSSKEALDAADIIIGPNTEESVADAILELCSLKSL